MYNTHWQIIDIHESFLSLSILIIAQLSADNTIMDHATEIQEKTDIVYDEQQPLLALIYDNDEARTFDFSYIVNDQLDALEMDDYVYYFSFEFRTE